MKHCPNRSCPHFRAVGSPAEYVADLALCTDCGAALHDGPAPEDAAPAEVSTPPVLRRLAISLAVIPVLFVLPWFSLPGVDVDALRSELAHLRAELVHLSFRPPASFGVFALGLSPLVSASVVVGLAMLIVPRWRELLDRAEGQRKLRRATLVITILLALSQSYAIARMLQILPDVYVGSTLVTVLTLTAGAMLFVMAAELLSRHALGNGFSLLLLYGALGEEIDRAMKRVAAGDGGPLAPGALALLLGAPIVAVYVLGRVLHGYRGAEAHEHPSREKPASYRLHPTSVHEAGEVPPAPLAPFVRLLSSGIAPFVVAATVLTSSMMGLWTAPGLRDLAPWLRDGTSGTVAYVALVTAVAVILAFALHPAERVARLWQRGRDVGNEDAVAAARAEVRRAAVRTAVLAAGVGALAWLAHSALGSFPSAANLFVVTAVLLDLIAEWKARRASGELVTVATIHDVDAADAAAAALRAAGVAVHARGAQHLAMLQIFGPYVAVELMVAPERADVAAKILEPLGRTEEDAEEAAAPKRRRRKKKAAPAAD